MAKHIQRTPAQRQKLVKQIEALKAKGTPVVKACKKFGVNPVSYYNWRAGSAGKPSKTTKQNCGAAVPKVATAMQGLSVKLQRGLPGNNLVVAWGNPRDVRQALKALATFVRQ